jgi:hypothetical protein
MTGDFSSSYQILAVQSPTDKKYLWLGMLLLSAYIGPKCLPLSSPYLAVISTFFFGFLLAVMIMPCSVPTRNLFAPASELNSSTLPPTILSLPSIWSVKRSESIGPLANYLVSHHRTLPSVEEVMSSVPVFMDNHARWVTGSL